MSAIVTIFGSLACLALGVASGQTANNNEYPSMVHSPEPDLCFATPLLSLQAALGTPVCSSTARNATSPSHSSTEESPPEEDSGGWSGPHACAGSFCVYANPSFAANRGIAIISDGDTTNALANLPIFAQLAGPGAAALLAAADINTRSDGAATADVPNKGRGFVAARPIHRGEQLLAYTPALVLHRALVDDLPRAEQLRLLRDAVRRLPPPTRAAFWTQLGPTHAAGDTDILAIVMTNSFNLPLQLTRPPSQHPPPAAAAAAAFVGNFPEVALYNHDCRPNVAFHLEAGLVHRTHAARAVAAAGAELAISYVDAFRARAVRRARTRRNWGFACACAQCALPPALANASDHRLWRLHEVEGALALAAGAAGAADAVADDRTTAAGRGGDDVADRVELLLSLYRQERMLESHGAAAYQTAALNYNALGRSSLAVKYALLALEAFVVEHGAGSGGVKEMVALMEEPERHWSWRKRV